MSDEQRAPRWLATWREKRRRRPARKVGDRLFGSVDGDSEEKIAQRHTTGGGSLPPRIAGTTSKAELAAASCDDCCSSARLLHKSVRKPARQLVAGQQCSR